MAVLTLVSLPHQNPLLLLLLGLFTAGFVGVNAAGLACPRERRRLVELASMVFGVVAISCLVVATGGADGPLLVNSLALAAICVASLRGGFSTPRLLGPTVVGGLMWLEVHAVALVVRHIACSGTNSCSLPSGTR